MKKPNIVLFDFNNQWQWVESCCSNTIGVANSAGKVDQHGVSSGVQVPTENSDLASICYLLYFVFIVFDCIYLVYFYCILYLLHFCIYCIFVFCIFQGVFIALEYRCLKLLFSYV